MILKTVNRKQRNVDQRALHDVPTAMIHTMVEGGSADVQVCLVLLEISDFVLSVSFGTTFFCFFFRFWLS